MRRCLEKIQHLWSILKCRVQGAAGTQTDERSPGACRAIHCTRVMDVLLEESHTVGREDAVLPVGALITEGDLQGGLKGSVAEKPEAPLVVAVHAIGVPVHAPWPVERGMVHKHKVHSILEFVVEPDFCPIQFSGNLQQRHLLHQGPQG